MGWADCGTDSEGRPIGYAFKATCDHPGCEENIDRGLAYACEGMHGENGIGCEKYFCSEHMSCYSVIDDDDSSVNVCKGCAERLLKSGEWEMDEEEGVIQRKMEIMERVERKKHEFIVKNNDGPGRLLVGKQELGEIAEEAEGWGIMTLDTSIDAGAARLEVSGLKLYEMDDESYLEVAP